MRWALLLNAILQVGSVSAFLLVGSIEPSGWAKVAVVLAFIFGSIVLIYRKFPEYEVKRSLLFSLLAAVCFVVVYQVVGFSFAPGIVKDISLFSARHLTISSIVFLAMVAFYSLCCFCLAAKSANHRKNAQVG